jgi:WD40 repeat protein
MSQMLNPAYLHASGQAIDIEIDSLPMECVHTVNAHSSCMALAHNSRGDTIATGGDDKCVKIWSTKDMKT